MTKVCRTIAAGAAAALFAAGLLCAGARAQVLDQVPGDALVVVRVKNLGATSAKFAKFMHELGLDALNPDLADPLGKLQAETNISKGLNKDGDFAMAMLDATQFGQDFAQDKAMIALVPVSDYQAFLGNFADAKPNGELTEITLANDNQTSFVAHWGNFAALSPSKEVLAKKPTVGMKAEGLAAKELATKDVVFLANFNSMRTLFGGRLDAFELMGLPMLDSKLKENPNPAIVKFAPVFHAGAAQAFAVMKGFLRDAQAGVYSINIGNDGINTTGLVQFAPASYSANLIGAFKNTDGPLFAGLPPQAKYLVYGGSVADPKIGKQIIDDLSGPVLKELNGIGGNESKAITDWVDSLKQFVGAQTGGAFGLIAPTGMIGRDSLIQGVGINTGDVNAMVAAQKKTVAAQEGVLSAFGVDAEQFKMTVTEGAKTIDGVKFDQFKTDIKLDPNAPGAMQQQQAMTMLYGTGGQQYYVGPVGDKLVWVMGLADPQIADVVKSTKASDLTLSTSPSLKVVNDNLPKARMSVMYIGLDQFVATGMNYARQFGAGLNVPLPPDLPPIGMTISTEASAIRGDCFIPTSLVQSLIAAGIQGWQQMNGARPGGPGGI